MQQRMSQESNPIPSNRICHKHLSTPQRRPRHRIATNSHIRIHQNPLVIRLIQRRARRARRQRLSP
jgi:hypothetical protein